MTIAAHYPIVPYKSYTHDESGKTYTVLDVTNVKFKLEGRWLDTTMIRYRRLGEGQIYERFENDFRAKFSRII